LSNSFLIDSDSIRIGADFYRKYSVFLLFFVFVSTSNFAVAQESILEQRISLTDQKITVYEVFNRITELTGYFFIYDSKLVDSDKKVNVSSERKPLKQILNDLLEDKSLDFKVIEKHILIYKHEIQTTVNQSIKLDSARTITIKGQLYDKQTKKILPFVTIGIVEKNIGTVSNNDGIFILKLPSTYLNSTVIISHLGYKTQQLPIKLLINQKVDVFLETEFISIQEVIIRNVDPKEVIRKVYQNRYANFALEPIYITSFYREGVLKDGKYQNYSEAIVKIYKSPFTRGYDDDQIKLLQSRKVINIDQKDTLIIKLKAGLKSCLTLDLIKHIPDFIDPEFIDSYNYTKIDIVSMDSRNAYAIAFEQKETVLEPLYKGTLYIDMKTYAIVSADFEINPKYVKDTYDMFVVKKSKKISITPEKIGYTVSYIFRNDKYYLNHIRGDLTINYKKRYHLFSNDFSVFLELASCQFDTLNVQRFSREEKLKTNTVFLDTKFSFEETFWGDYNTITPEEKISQALMRNNTKMELVRPE